MRDDGDSALSAWSDSRTAHRTMQLLRDLLPELTHIQFLTDPVPVWQASAEAAGFVKAEANRSETLAALLPPTGLPATATEIDDLVQSIINAASAVLLATEPPTARLGGGRWPAFWAAPFAEAGWVLADAVRPALWDDGFVPLDCKEGLLLFVDPERVDLPRSWPAAMVHPHRASELTVMVENRFRAELAAFDQRHAETHAELQRLLNEHLAAIDALAADRTRLALDVAVLAERQRRADAERPSNAHETPTPSRWSAARLLRRKLFPAGEVIIAPVAAASPVDQTVIDLFDEEYYRAQVPHAGPDALAHYLAVGEAAGRRPNPWFDPAYYRRNNPDVTEAGLGAFEHYCRWGAQEGRQASVEFHTGFYLASYPDVQASGVHPMLHFAFVGRHEGRGAVPPLQ